MNALFEQIAVIALIVTAVGYLAVSRFARRKKSCHCAGCPTAKENRRPSS